MRCPQCDAESTDDARFCRSCGALLATNPEKTVGAENVGGVLPPLPAPPPTLRLDNDDTATRARVPAAPAPPRSSTPPPPETSRSGLKWLVLALALVVVAIAGGAAYALTRPDPKPISGGLDDASATTATTPPTTVTVPVTSPTSPPTTPTTPPTIPPRPPKPGARAITLINTVLRAEVGRDWNTARMYDVLSNQTDAQLTTDYADLRNQRAYVSKTAPPVLIGPRLWRVRFTLVAHDIDLGSRYTFAVCELWDVNVAARTIHAVEKGTLTSDPHPGTPEWLNPPDIAQCP
jgi:hypothetical protein